MWFSNLKETARNVWNASKQIVEKKSPTQRIVDSIAENQDEIIPTKTLNQLADATYEPEQFDEIVNILIQRLRVFQYDYNKSQQTLNLLIATNYLIKHGATGFVDEFRLYTDVFQKYQSLKQVETHENSDQQEKLDYNLERIKSRASHIETLLKDKEKLLKQKQLSMLVKQKLKLYEKGKLSELKFESFSNRPQFGKKKLPNQEELTTKLEGIMEKYVWKYVDKLDDTIEIASEKIMEQIDKYIIGGEEPQTFELEEEPSPKKETPSIDKSISDSQSKQDDDLMKKLQEESSPNIPSNLNADLLQFQQVKENKVSPKEQSLL